MNIQIIRSVREDKNNKSGIGYYADFLEERLTQAGYRTEIVSFELNLDNGVMNLLRNIVSPGINIIKHRKSTDVTHATAEHCSLFLPLSGGKRIVTFHHVVKKDEITTKSWKIIWSLSALVSKIFADEFIAISPQTKRDMIDLLGIEENRISIAMHPPKSDMHPTNAPRENIFLFIGVLANRKNPLAAISVFENIVGIPKYSGFKLIMCGDGPLKKDIENIIAEKNLGKSIELISSISVDELRDLYNKSKILFNTSKFEGLGITTLEAQLCGTPTLYFKDAEIPPEVMVAAIPCDDADDMAKKAITLLEDENLAKTKKKKGISFAKEFGKDYETKLKEVYSD